MQTLRGDAVRLLDGTRQAMGSEYTVHPDDRQPNCYHLKPKVLASNATFPGRRRSTSFSSSFFASPHPVHDRAAETLHSLWDADADSSVNFPRRRSDSSVSEPQGRPGAGAAKVVENRQARPRHLSNELEDVAEFLLLGLEVLPAGLRWSDLERYALDDLEAESFDGHVFCRIVRQQPDLPDSNIAQDL